MSFIEKSDMELIHLATISDDLNLLKSLVSSANMNVRRALAKNKNINSTIANQLLFDPVLNVSYLASLNKNTTKTRAFEEHHITPCVKCDIDERELNCLSCSYYKSHRIN